MEKTKFWYISSNKVFSGLTEKDRDTMASMLRPVNVKKKSIIYNMGDSADNIYILKEGRIKITHITEDGKELTLDILEPGDIFGELALAGEQERETSAEALEDSFICTIKREDFEDFVGKNPLLSLTITKWIGSRLRRIENRLENLLFQDVRTRILTLFNDLAARYGTDVDEGRKLNIRLSHQEIANLVGATRETVTLEINNLKKSGEILTQGKEFILPVKGPS
ncbi:MAG: Crp/Fnr family transcriptional regulator [Thermodesulfobacteriota bacterium]|nr:MAG: Crp/Fnr family transcriptional regulator [Thermodesulfobacteriota bacterium]